MLIHSNINTCIYAGGIVIGGVQREVAQHWVSMCSINRLISTRNGALSQYFIEAIQFSY